MVAVKRVRDSCLFCNKQAANPAGALDNLTAKAQVLLGPRLIFYQALVETFQCFEVLLIEVHLQMSWGQACVRYEKATSS